jgi:hypothetical protein
MNGTRGCSIAEGEREWKDEGNVDEQDGKELKIRRVR